MINISYGNKGLPDLYFLYSKVKDFHEFLEHKQEPNGKFRAKDHIDFHTTESQTGANLQNVDNLTIKTNAVYKFTRGDLLYSAKDKRYWLITNVTVMDDNQNKANSLSPRKWTILELSGMEE